MNNGEASDSSGLEWGSDALIGMQGCCRNDRGCMSAGRCSDSGGHQFCPSMPRAAALAQHKVLIQARASEVGNWARAHFGNRRMLATRPSCGSASDNPDLIAHDSRAVRALVGRPSSCCARLASSASAAADSCAIVSTAANRFRHSCHAVGTQSHSQCWTASSSAPVLPCQVTFCTGKLTEHASTDRAL